MSTAKNTVSRQQSISKYLGLGLALLGGLITVGTAIYITKSGGYLFSLIFVAWVISEVNTKKTQNAWRAAILGAAAFICEVMLAGVIWYTNTGGYTFCLIFVVWIVSQLDDRM